MFAKYYMDRKDIKTSIGPAIVSYFRKHPIQLHILLICIACLLLSYIAMLFLDVFTEHGTYKVVPDVKGQQFSQAKETIESNGFRWEISDSIYNDTFAPGCVMEQTPKENTKVKSNRTIYVVINAFTPRLVNLPNVCDMSERQAIAKLQEVGLRNIVVETVDSPYKGLVLECKFNGLAIAPGKKIPSSSNITLYVGDGQELTDSIATDSIQIALDYDLFEEVPEDANAF